MENKSNIDLAKAWIALQYVKKGASAYDANFWAFTMLDELRDKDLERHWNVINEIKNLDDSDFMLSNLAAGPVEDLLVTSGKAFINRIEASARDDERFRAMLGMVWKNDIPEEVWARVERAAGRKS